MNYNYTRRKSREVKVGRVRLGGNNPIRVQSMTNCDTNDTEACVAQARAIEAAGGEIVRLTTQGVREAANLANVRKALEELGDDIPLVADVHFNPKAAFEAATTAHKVRINPGNFVDAARTFRKLEFTDEEYAAEIERIRQSLIPFLELCRSHGTAVRLGVNHGSLSDRIMSRFGDTAPGMVESVMEYLRICREVDFNDIVISIKASNTVVMVETVRLLVSRMNEENMDYPLHLGVTEAGDAEDGRIKSAVGIGTLLHEGIGDTIRVSLSEPPENEPPVARMLLSHIMRRVSAKELPTLSSTHRDFPAEQRRKQILAWTSESNDEYKVITAEGDNAVGEMAYAIDKYHAEGGTQPIAMKLHYDYEDINMLRVAAGADFGALLLNGYGDAIAIENPHFDAETLSKMEFDILQATRMRITKTEFIACPSCGRTLFDLQSTLQEVKEAVTALGIKGLKIGVMGCIVNGPGEMADADYGYVGAGPGRVSIYRGKELITKNIPAAEALPALIDLIKAEKNAL